jgi:hypothetical protein
MSVKLRYVAGGPRIRLRAVPGIQGIQGIPGQVQGIEAGQGIAIDLSDPVHPKISVDAVAAEIPFTPTGQVGSTDVQTAIAELDSKKLSVLDAASNYQPLDADLTAISGIGTAAFGRGLLTTSSAEATRVRLRQFDTVADLIADTSLTYSAGLMQVAAGDIVEAQGFRFALAASGATDHHLATAGGVKLYVVKSDAGWVVEAFDDGSSGEIPWQKAIDACKADGGGRVHLMRDRTINDTVRVWGSFTYRGILISGDNVQVTSTHAGPAIEFVPDARPDGDNAAPELKQRSEMTGIDFTGPGKAVVGSVGLLVRHGGTVDFRQCKARNFEIGLQGDGALIERFTELELSENALAINFSYDGTFAPNDLHFLACKVFQNTRALYIEDFPNGSITFNECEMEGNNVVSGHAADGVNVFHFKNAGRVNFFGCHLEQNPGQTHVLFEGGSPNASLNIIGSDFVPGSNGWANVELSGQGQLFAVGARITNSTAGGRPVIVLGAGCSALIGSDVGANVSGDLSRLVTIHNGQIGTRVDRNGLSGLPGVRAKGASNVGLDVEGQSRFVNASNTRLGYSQVTEGGNYALVSDQNNQGFQFNTMIGGVGAARFYIGRVGSNSVEPGANNTTSLGTASLRWSEVFAANGTINTSDEADKQQIGAIPDEWLDAWGDVQWSRFKWNDAVQSKGNGARWHVGLIAQRVRDAFAARGLDAQEIGLLCYDEWDDQYGTDETGALVLIAAAGSRWGIRYDEAQALEAAWVRRAVKGLSASDQPGANRATVFKRGGLRPPSGGFFTSGDTS